MKSDFENKSPHEQLDAILNELLLDHFRSHIVTGLRTRFSVQDTNVIILILNKLKKDGYITDDKSLSDGITISYHDGGQSVPVVLNENADVYYLTFEGRVFITAEGGYTQLFFLRNMSEIARIDRIQIEKRQVKQDERLEKIQKDNLFLTKVVAVTAAIVSLVAVLQLSLNFVKDFPDIFFYFLRVAFF